MWPLAVGVGFFGKAGFGWAPAVTSLLQAGSWDSDHALQGHTRRPWLRSEPTVGVDSCCSSQECIQSRSTAWGARQGLRGPSTAALSSG